MMVPTTAMADGARINAGAAWSLGVACHVDGTTHAGFLPRAWDHRSASHRTTRRVLSPAGSGRLFDLHVLFAGMEVADDGVPGGRRG